MNDDIKYMQLALAQAGLAADRGEVPVGAVIVCGGRVVATGHNMTETLNDPTAHAEMIALTAACGAVGGKYLNECTLYVTVEPCPMCAAALGWAQIGRIVYGAADPKRGYSVFGRTDDAPHKTLLHPKTSVTPGVLADDAAALMKEFFRSRR